MNRRTLLPLVLLAITVVTVAVWPRDPLARPSASVATNVDIEESAPNSQAESLSEIEESDDRIPAVESEVRPLEDARPRSGTSLVIDVRSSGGAPVRSARVVFVRNEKVLAKRSTGKDGQVLLRGLGRDVDVFVLTGRVVRVRRHLDDAVGSHVLAFPQGATLRGTVLIDGMPPKGSLQLTLRLSETTGFELPPSFVQQQQPLPGEVEDKPYLTTWTGSAGYFEFADVPPTCTGTIEVPWDYWWENDADPLEVHDVARDLVVRLETPPAITGRIVKPGTREGAPRARIRYEVAASDRYESMEFTGDLVTNAGGRFQYDFPRRRIARFAATVHVEGVGQATLDIRDVPPRGLDLGDIALVAGEEVYFVVHDVDGKPIEDAIASTLDEPPLQSHTTDASGRGRFASLPPTLNSIRVRALGYRSVVQRVVTGTPTEDSPIAVTLERLPQLNVVVHQSNGTPARGVAVQLSSRDAVLFVDDDGAASRMPVQLDIGAAYPDPWIGGTDFGHEVAYAVDENGRARILGLNPHALFALRVIDKSGAPVVEQSVEPAFLQAKDPLVIRLDALPRTLELLVIDRDRKPIEGAAVSLRGTLRALAKTQSNGIARITPIYAKRIDLDVKASGFAFTRVGEVPLSHELEHREVIMTRGYSVRVRVVDASDNPMPADSVFAAIDFHAVGTVSRCAGEPCFVIDDLPPETIRLEVTVMGATLHRDHDPQDPVAELKLPEHGSLLIEFSEPITNPEQYTVALTPVHDEDGTVPDHYGVFLPLSGPPPVNSFVLPLVFSGRYTVSLHGVDHSSGEPVGRSRTENVVIRTGERTVVRAVITR